jgi:hypothetical protein
MLIKSLAHSRFIIELPFMRITCGIHIPNDAKKEVLLFLHYRQETKVKNMSEITELVNSRERHQVHITLTFHTTSPWRADRHCILSFLAPPGLTNHRFSRNAW